MPRIGWSEQPDLAFGLFRPAGRFLASLAPEKQMGFGEAVSSVKQDIADGLRDIMPEWTQAVRVGTSQALQEQDAFVSTATRWLDGNNIFIGYWEINNNK